MRTTVEITPEHRTRLLELAARRGDKGFSGIVREALSSYFDGLDARQRKVRKALDALGSFSEEDAERLREDAETLRRTWR